MLELTTSFHFHANGKLIRGYRGVGVPRVGDEVRMSEEKYFRVTRVVWVYDEPDAVGQRVNIALEPIE